MSIDQWLGRRVGRTLILGKLRESPSVPKIWWPYALSGLSERGLVQKSTTLHRGWEITAKGLAALVRLEQNATGTGISEQASEHGATGGGTGC